MAILENLRLILENTHNGFTFQQRCRSQKIIIQKLPDDTILAYYGDDRDEQIPLDTTIPPFDKILRFS